MPRKRKRYVGVRCGKKIIALTPKEVKRGLQRTKKYKLKKPKGKSWLSFPILGCPSIED